MRLQDRVAIVTGAAQGIGAACAQLFAAQGARVVVSDVNEVGGMALVRDIAAAGGTALFARADVAVKADAERLVRFAVEHFGRLDVLVSNAGIVHGAEFLDLAEEDFDRVLRVNLKGAFLCGQAAARQMVSQNPRARGLAVLGNEAARARIMSRTPLGRLGEPEEVARVALFLASDDASYMSGTTIYPDGGRLALNYTV